MARKRMKWRANQNIGSSAISEARPAFHGQIGSSMTVPVNENFCSRLALKMPQYDSTRPLSCSYHGW
jgi:hypothetical protein